MTWLVSGPTSTDQRLRQAERLGALTDRDRARAGDRLAAARLIAAQVLARLSAEEAAAVVHPGLCGHPAGYGTDPAGDLLAGPLAEGGLSPWGLGPVGPADEARRGLVALAEARVAAELPVGVAVLVLGRARYLRLAGLDRLPRGAAQAVSAASGDEELRGRLAVAWLGVLSPASRAALVAQEEARHAAATREAEEQARRQAQGRAALEALAGAYEEALERWSRALWEGRRDRAEWAAPDGSGRPWEPSSRERQGCCARVRRPSHAWPWSLLRHTASREHCRALVEATALAAREGRLAAAPGWALLAVRLEAEWAPGDT